MPKVPDDVQKAITEALEQPLSDRKPKGGKAEKAQPDKAPPEAKKGGLQKWAAAKKGR